MAQSRNVNDILMEQIVKGLDSTSRMTQTLLAEIRESEADFSAIKTELNFLKDNIRTLSEILKGADSSKSITTRVALIEQNIETIEKWMENHSSNVHNKEDVVIVDIKEEINNLERKIDSISSVLNDLKLKYDESERKQKEYLEREIELQHEDKKSKIATKAERQANLTKIIGAIILAALGAIGTSFANGSCNKNQESSVKEYRNTTATSVPASPRP